MEAGSLWASCPASLAEMVSLCIQWGSCLGIRWRAVREDTNMNLSFHIYVCTHTRFPHPCIGKKKFNKKTPCCTNVGLLITKLKTALQVWLLCWNQESLQVGPHETGAGESQWIWNQKHRQSSEMWGKPYWLWVKTWGPTPLQESRDLTEDCNWGHLDLNSKLLWIFFLMCMGVLFVCLSVWVLCVCLVPVYARKGYWIPCTAVTDVIIWMLGTWVLCKSWRSWSCEPSLQPLL